MFKKLIQATVAATLVASPLIAANAQAQQVTTVKPNGATVTHRANGGTTTHKANGTTVTHKVNGTTVRKTTTVAPRRWAKGQKFDRRYAPRYAVVDYRRYKARRLYAPPRGYHWVRSNNDAVLVGITTGLIAATLTDALR